MCGMTKKKRVHRRKKRYQRGGTTIFDSSKPISVGKMIGWGRQRGGSNAFEIIAKSLFPGVKSGKYKQFGSGIRNKYGIAPRKSVYIHK